jgi:hypothetical protein
MQVSFEKGHFKLAMNTTQRKPIQPTTYTNQTPIHQHAEKARHATPFGEWPGLSAEEGRGKQRNASGKRTQL